MIDIQRRRNNNDDDQVDVAKIHPLGYCTTTAVTVRPVAIRATWRKFTCWVINVPPLRPQYGPSQSGRRGTNSNVRTLFATCSLSSSCQHQGDVAQICPLATVLLTFSNHFPRYKLPARPT